MSERERIEQEIRDYLPTETDAVTFSNHLFGQFTGLFSKLGKTVEDRREVCRSELWKQANSRFTELLRREVEAVKNGTIKARRVDFTNLQRL
jgi:hypothetical protein